MKPTTALHRLAPPLLALLLLGTTSASDTTWSGEFTTTEVQALGSTTTHAGLAILLQEKTSPTHETGSPEFLLQAEALRVETDHTNISIDSIVDYRHAPHTTTSTHRDATVQGQNHQDGYQFSVWPLRPGSTNIEVEESSCTQILPSDQETIGRTALVKTSRGIDQANTQDALLWAGCGPTPTAVTIHGEFMLRLWAWEAILQDDGKSTALESGKRNPEAMPTGTPDVSETAGEASELFLYAYNATLTIPRLEGNYHAYLYDAYVTVLGGGLHASDARGHIQGPDGVLETVDKDLALQGVINANLAGQGAARSMQMVVQGGVWSLSIDGQSTTTDTSTPQDASGSWWMLLAFLALAPLHIIQRRLRATYHLRRAQAQPYRNVSALLHHASKAIRLNPRMGHAYLVRAFAHTQVGNLMGALQDHERAEKHLHQSDPRRTRNAAEAARSATQLLQKDPAWYDAAQHWSHLYRILVQNTKNRDPQAGTAYT